jgi:hypothetical protein
MVGGGVTPLKTMHRSPATGYAATDRATRRCTTLSKPGYGRARSQTAPITGKRASSPARMIGPDRARCRRLSTAMNPSAASRQKAGVMYSITRVLVPYG